MFQRFNNRAGHYLLLLLVGGLLFFPNLGVHSLWEIDEAHNAECAREMREADNWVYPTFNFVIRTDKPALLYWGIMSAYELFGVGEFAARFWSAVCGLGSVLLTYELGRRMFGPATGLLAGVVLASAIMFCVSSHAATPDALLIFFTLLTLWLFWEADSRGSRSWLVTAGVSAGFAVLAKGPVGFLLPATAIGLFLLWERRLGVLWNRRLLLGLILLGLVALPWYCLVAWESNGYFIEMFLFKHNVGRFMGPMERHGGPIFYHPLVLLAAFAPWSAFLGLAVWYGTGRRARTDTPGSTPSPPAPLPKEERGEEESPTPLPVSDAARSRYRFLWCWILLWLVFFSFAGTKLPNYVLPIYPALAILTARFLVRWRDGLVAPPRWLVAVSLSCIALTGVVVGAGLLIASGHVSVVNLRGRELPELAPWAAAGLLPLAAAVAAWQLWRRERRAAMLGALAAGCVGFVGLLAAFGPPAVDRHKAPRALAAELGRHQLEREVQVGCFGRYQPGLVFYARQRIEFMGDDLSAADLLHRPVQTFLVIPAADWQRLQAKVESPCRVVAQHRDFQTGQDFVLVTNRP